MAIDSTKYRELDLTGINEKIANSGDKPVSVIISAFSNDVDAPAEVHDLSLETGKAIETTWQGRQINVTPEMTRAEVRKLFKLQISE